MSRQLLTGAILLLLGAGIFAQPPYREIYEKPYFNGQYPQKVPVLFRAYPIYSGQNAFTVFFPVKIQYDFLQFVTDNGSYSAAAEIELRMRKPDGVESKAKIWKTALTVDKFEDTRDRSRHLFTMDSLQAEPGVYTIIFKYRDLNGERQLSYTLNLTLKAEDKPFVSPPLFIESSPGMTAPAFLPADRRPSPLMGYWDFNKPLEFLLQAWQHPETPITAVKTELIRTEDGITVFAEDTTITTSESQQFTLSFHVSPSALKEGKYRLRTIYQTGSDSIRKVLPFEIVWFDKPISLWDNELSIKPLQYITDEATFKQLSDGNQESQQQKLRGFWEQRDPTPETPFNELMQQFYSRVDSALTRFSGRRKLGWNTDPGKIYITMGPPAEIDDHSLDPIETPYMRWIYRIDDKEVIYTFRAVDGRKEYELVDAVERNM